MIRGHKVETRRIWGARPGQENPYASSDTAAAVGLIYSQLAPDALAGASLENKFGIRAAQELKALAQEKDFSLFAAGLLVLGRRLEEGKQVSLAAEVYGALERLSPAPEYRQSAHECLAALTGERFTSGRAEILLKNFVATATDYRLIVPMMAGSALFQAARTALWSRLLVNPAASAVTRGFGARLAASAGAFALEAPAFTALNRALVNAADGAGSTSFSQDLARNALSLGALKFGSAAGSAAAAGPLSRSWQQALQPASAYLGMLGAHYLEVKAGWRAPQERGAVFAETLASLVALGVGNRLGTRVLGSGWSSWNRDLALRERQLAEARPVVQALPILRPAGEGPMVMMSEATGWDKLLSWLGSKLPRGVSRAEPAPESGPTPAEMIGPKDHERMRIVFKKYPKLRRAMDKAGYEAPQKRDLLNLVVSKAEDESPAALEQLASALIAMRHQDFSYEQVSELLDMLGEEAGSYADKIRQIPAAIAGVRPLKIDVDAKHRLLMELGSRAGAHSDLVFANLYPTLKILTWNGCSPGVQARDMIFEMIDAAGDQIGIALANFPDAFKLTLTEMWVFRNKISFYGRLAARSARPQLLEWRFQEGFKATMGELERSKVDSDERYDLLTVMMQSTGPKFDDALEYLPGVLQVLRKNGWGSHISVNTLTEVFRRAGPDSSRVLKWMPYLVNTMRGRGWEPATQGDIILDIAAHTGTMDDFVLHGFVTNLLQGPKLNDGNN